MDFIDLFGIDFHDLPINSLLFDFDNENIELVVSLYDELNDNYQIKGIIFKTPSDVSIEGNLTLHDNAYRINGNIDEIIKYNDDYQVKLYFFLSHSSFTLNLKCRNIHIVSRGISDK